MRKSEGIKGKASDFGIVVDKGGSNLLELMKF
jgi:hypothetical protein